MCKKCVKSVYKRHITAFKPSRIDFWRVLVLTASSVFVWLQVSRYALYCRLQLPVGWPPLKVRENYWTFPGCFPINVPWTDIFAKRPGTRDSPAAGSDRPEKPASSDGQTQQRGAFAKPIIMAEIVTVFLQGIEGLVFNSPACPACTHTLINVLIGECQVGHPTETYFFSLVVDLMVFKYID